MDKANAIFVCISDAWLITGYILLMSSFVSWFPLCFRYSYSNPIGASFNNLPSHSAPGGSMEDRVTFVALNNPYTSQIHAYSFIYDVANDTEGTLQK